MRDKLVIDSIDDSKSAAFLCFYRGGGWTCYKQTPRANSVNFVNQHTKKLRTLICSTRVDRPAPGPNRPTAQFGAQHMPPAFWWS
jgi:hypothetical protein